MAAIKQTRGERIFNVINMVFLGLLGLSMFYPFLYTLSLSLSTAAAADGGGFFLYPHEAGGWKPEVTFFAYKAIFSDPNLLMGYLNTIFRTVIGTVLSVFMTCLCAYPLSRKNLPHRRGLTFIVLFTMLFGGGLIPNYLLFNELGLLDNRLVYILPGLLQAFNVILVKNFFQNISESLHEAASIDGASEWYILFRIYIPLSKPVLATVGLFTGIMHWNSWFDSMIYMTTESKMVVQTFLQRIILETDIDTLTQGAGEITQFTPETIKAATVIITIVPMLIVYPWLQKYFAKGIMLGGVKE
ncbi:MAG: carbohydrate ABC transporter permease [Planctomycetota bacterium]|jgi:putative aldouronate transport system permease protein